MIFDTNPAPQKGQISIKPKKLLQTKSQKKQIVIAHRLSGDELLRINDTILYEKSKWKCPRNISSKQVYKLQISMTNLTNLRINLWRILPSAISAASDLEQYPISIILPSDVAKYYMSQCENDLERLAHQYIYVHNGNSIRI